MNRQFHYTEISIRNIFMRRFLLFFACAAGCAADTKILLRPGWAIQSSAEVRETGAALSAVPTGIAGFTRNQWSYLLPLCVA